MSQSITAIHGRSMDNTEWIKDRVIYLKALKNPSDQQALLIHLSEKENRTAHDEKKLVVLVRAEKASIRATKARQEAANMINSEKRAAKEADRKARNHRLILQGVLFDLAGLNNHSRGELLGLLLAGSSTADPQRWASWKQAGDALLAQHDSQKI